MPLLAVSLLLTGCAAEETDIVKPQKTSSEKASVIPSPKTVPPTPTATTVTIDPEQSLAPIEGSDGEGTKVSRTKVDWTKYSEGLQGQIDQDTTLGNCKGLDSYYAGLSSTSDLYKYLNEALVLAGCS